MNRRQLLALGAAAPVLASFGAAEVLPLAQRARMIAESLLLAPTGTAVIHDGMLFAHIHEEPFFGKRSRAIGVIGGRYGTSGSFLVYEIKPLSAEEIVDEVVQCATGNGFGYDPPSFDWLKGFAETHYERVVYA